MDLGGFFLISIVLFTIIYFAVRLAINPLLSSQGEIIAETDSDKQISELVKLRDMDIFNNDELESAIKQYQNKNDKKDKKDYKNVDYGDYEQYKKYAEILNELKEMDYFTDEDYCIKIDNLKKYFEID